MATQQLAPGSPNLLHRGVQETQEACQGGGSLTSSASFSSVSSLFSCWSFALFLNASFSGLLGGQRRPG